MASHNSHDKPIPYRPTPTAFTAVTGQTQSTQQRAAVPTKTYQTQRYLSEASADSSWSPANRWHASKTEDLLRTARTAEARQLNALVDQRHVDPPGASYQIPPTKKTVCSDPGSAAHRADHDRTPTLAPMRHEEQDGAGLGSTSQRRAESPRASPVLAPSYAAIGKSSRPPAATSATDYEVSALQSSATSFVALLETFGITYNAHGAREHAYVSRTSGTPPSSGNQSARSSEVPGRRRPVTSRVQRDSESEGDEPGPVDPQTENISESIDKRFACPFFKLDSGLYKACKVFGPKVNRIETIKRHVTGPKHEQSPHMNHTKRQQILGLGRIPDPAQRWKVMYAIIAEKAVNDPGIPSPYVGTCATRSRPARQLQLSMTSTPSNPDAQAYFQAAEQVRRQLLDHLAAIENQVNSRIQAARHDGNMRGAAARAEAETRLRRLGDRFFSGLPLDGDEAGESSLSGQLNREHAHDTTANFEPTARGPLGIGLSSPPLPWPMTANAEAGNTETVAAAAAAAADPDLYARQRSRSDSTASPPKAPTSPPGDSGYSSLPEDGLYCICGLGLESWCLACGKPCN
ncbi:uncharacterized protein HMPREF1541_11097 [Cyphellophora europaea CBS 101466]|uniref:Uncharacterized protein n=1 Tax=Cyphellophora europaea (strain CBS 101466) TaxID=1220924 RepID=W2S6V2_CYPE1|nr:uncharacterized protein HMPREF1541_11097 [Cyphellophora europaea CBS 101466]ETN43773.1 hypothetical protein HMPREF1541_11097 [Cyphellophora europaea CBS 101466]